MRCKPKMAGRWTMGLACGLVGLAACGAGAQTTTATTGSMNMSATTTVEPTRVSGTVLRYYTDRSGYVTAMDVQTADGVRMVHFTPGMAQRMYTTYPVGGKVDVWVNGSPMWNDTRWDTVGLGADRPAAWWNRPFVSDVDLLESEPSIMAGSKLVTISGKLAGLIYSDVGEVLALVLDVPATATPVMDAATPATVVNNGRMLVRVTRHFRHIAPGYAGTERVTPWFRGSNVEVTGYPEFPRYGVVTPYANRLIAYAMVVNGRAAGPLSFPAPRKDSMRTLIGWDLGSNKTPEEQRATDMGYSTYNSGQMSGQAGTTTPSP